MAESWTPRVLFASGGLYPSLRASTRASYGYISTGGCCVKTKLDLSPTLLRAPVIECTTRTGAYKINMSKSV